MEEDFVDGIPECVPSLQMSLSEAEKIFKATMSRHAPKDVKTSLEDLSSGLNPLESAELGCAIAYGVNVLRYALQKSRGDDTEEQIEGGLESTKVYFAKVKEARDSVEYESKATVRVNKEATDRILKSDLSTVHVREERSVVKPQKRGKVEPAEKRKRKRRKGMK
jgi:hypothetical protein